MKPGNYRTTINHYHVLRTLQAMFGLAPIENTAAVAPITNIWSNRSHPRENSRAAASSMS